LFSFVNFKITTITLFLLQKKFAFLDAVETLVKTQTQESFFSTEKPEDFNEREDLESKKSEEDRAGTPHKD
jgi:hypothetical protein